MPLLLDEFESLKRLVADLQRKHDEVAGAEKQVAARVRERFGCKTYREAKRLREKRHRELVALAEQFTAEKERFLTDHADQLGDVE